MIRYGIKPAYEGERDVVVSPRQFGRRGYVQFYVTVVEVEGHPYQFVSHMSDLDGITGDPVEIGERLVTLLPDRDDILVLPLLTDPVIKLDGPGDAPELFKSVAQVMAKNERALDTFISDIFEIEQPGFGVALMRLDTCAERTFRAERHFF